MLTRARFDPTGRRMMDAPRDATMGSPLLVPFDGSAHAESVFPYVALLADGEQDVILLQVVPEAQSVNSPLGDVMLSASELRQATDTSARSDLDRAAAQLASLAPSLRIEQLVETGDPSQRICEVAASRKARGIVLSSQGVSATGPSGFGTVVGRVVSMAPVPVMVVRPNGIGPEPNLVA